MPAAARHIATLPCDESREDDRLSQIADVPAGWMTDAQIDVSTTTLSPGLAVVSVSAEGTLATTVAWPFLSYPLKVQRNIVMRQYR
ncbi:MAG TPA: hypothetical protein VHZ24_13905 [Pirellulales bacterium]|jgi:hypothetical protein|nr:hypothetical protein [Pirellulales bacterium]